MTVSWPEQQQESESLLHSLRSIGMAERGDRHQHSTDVRLEGDGTRTAARLVWMPSTTSHCILLIAVIQRFYIVVHDQLKSAERLQCWELG